MEILSTTDYSQFKIIASNREVSSGHVAKLKKSILEKNLLEVNPIIVNKEMFLTDGQHRLQAALELQLPIFYIISDGISNVDISRLNTNKKLWTSSDYLTYWCVEGKESYKKIAKFMNMHEQLPLTCVLKMMSPSYIRGATIFKEGSFEIESVENAEKIAKQLELLAPFGKFVYSSVFINFYCKVFTNEKFEIDKLIHQIGKAPRAFVPCTNDKQYSELFEEIYNRDVRSNNRVTFK